MLPTCMRQDMRTEQRPCPRVIVTLDAAFRPTIDEQGLQMPWCQMATDSSCGALVLTVQACKQTTDGDAGRLSVSMMCQSISTSCLMVASMSGYAGKV